MKTLLRVTKYIFITIVAVVVIAVIGLLSYYQHLYEPMALPSDTPVIKAVAQPSVENGHPVLLPVPKQVNWTQGFFKLSPNAKVMAASEDMTSINDMWRERMKGASEPGSGTVQFVKDEDLFPQAYTLSIKPQGIKISYKTLQGAFYALSTLKQIAVQTAFTLTCVDISDSPDLNVRGAMIDVSRGKVPQLETIFELVDVLADLKYNQLQLYIEGFSFAYPSFKQYWEKTETPLTPEEIRTLDAYCKARYIELVPNQNSLGHMQDWLKQDDLKDLAECPEGYKLLGLIDVKTTLSPTDPRSLELVKKMSEDLLPNFTSTQFNVNLDEPFELGKSKQRPIEDPKEIARLYMDYVKKLNEYVTSKQKTMMMWGDVVSRSPEVIGDIPQNVTLLEWRYEAIQPFETACEKYQAAGVRYMVCPGTSSWSSFTGRTDNMLGNIANAAESAVTYGAVGMLITDWGDTPHLQYLPVSYPGYAYAAALSWNFKSKHNVPLDEYLSRVVFHDSSSRFGNLVLDLGRYNQFEEHGMMSMTTTALALRLGMMDPVMYNAVRERMKSGIFELAAFDDETTERIRGLFENPKPYQSKALLSYVGSLDSTMSEIKLDREDSKLILDEYKNAIRMIRLSTMMKHYMLFHLEQTDEENRSILNEMKTLCSSVITEHKRLWMMRNKRSGVDASVESFEKLNISIDEQLANLDANIVVRSGKRGVEKMVAAIAALYLGAG